MSRIRRAAPFALVVAATALLGGCSAGYDARMDEAMSNPPGSAGELEVLQVLNATADGDYKNLGGEAMSALAGYVIFDEPWIAAQTQTETEAEPAADETQIESAEAEPEPAENAGEEIAEPEAEGGTIYEYGRLLSWVEQGFDPEAEADAERDAELGDLADKTGAPERVLRMLMYVKYYCQQNAASDMLDVLASCLHMSEIDGARREAYESFYLRMLVGSLGDNEAYAEGLSSFNTMYNNYIDIGVDGFEQRAFAELQTCPDMDVAGQFLDFLISRDRGSEITSDLLVSTSARQRLDGDYEFDTLNFLTYADKFCFESAEGEAVFDEAVAKLEDIGCTRYYETNCKKLSQVIDFEKSNPKLFDYITKTDFSSSSQYYAFSVVKNSLYSDELMDKIYKPDQGEPSLPPLDWTRDMLADYFGSSSFTPNDPQYEYVLFVQDSEDSEGMDSVFSEFTYYNIYQAADPDKASAAVYYSVTHPFYNYYRFETGETVPAYSCYVSIKAVNLRTGATIGSLSYSRIPAYQVSVSWVPDEWYEELPDIDWDEVDALAQKVEAAVAEPVEQTEEGEGLL